MPVAVEEVEIKPGLTLDILNANLENKFTANRDFDTSPVSFGFFFSGKGETKINHDGRKKMDFKGKPGLCGITYFPRSLCVRHFPSQNRLRQLHILVDHFLLHELISGVNLNIDPDFHPVLNQKKNTYFCKQTEISYPMQLAVNQLIECPFQGNIKKIYLESKAMELIILLMDALIFNTPCQKGPKSPDRSETDRIYEAREIIFNRYIDPPSLSELSRLVGLNEFKLKQGFKNVFGNTVFGCLYEFRMEHARLHLEEGSKSVKEIAFAVGYQSVSRFSDAFKRRFGVRPTHYQP